jgi:ABC-type bacteriocin/lantibiotic exporter with double-glycine peptidase domain
MLRILLIALFATACTVPYAGGARPVSASAIQPGWLRAAPTQVVRQRHDTDCGLAALAMVAGSWNRRWNVDELARELPPTTKGVKLLALRDLARDRGLDAYAIAATPADLAHELAHGRPVVLGLVLPHDRNYNRRHYEVAIAMDPRDGTIITLDPASGRMMRRSREVLDVEWKPAAYAALVVVGDLPKPVAAR